MRSLLAHLSIGLAAVLGGACTLASALPVVPPTNPAPVARRAAVTTAATTVRATQVQVNDDDAHAAFKEGSQFGCNDPGTCTVTFSTVAAGHRRLIEHANCIIYVAQPGTLDFVTLIDASDSAPREYLTTTRSFGEGGAGYFVDVSTKFPFEAGETPTISASSEQMGIGIMQCTIMGRDIVLP